MRNENRRNRCGVWAVCLTAALLLTGCTGASSAAQNDDAQGEASAAESGAAQVSMSDEARDSITYLRDAMQGTPLLLAAAYLGTEEEPEEHTEQWAQKFWMAEEYPFIKELPKEQIIGKAGEVYCIVPGDPMASLAINGADGEVLYRSEVGEPVLLLCNASDGVEVTLVDSKGEQLLWQPMLEDGAFLSVPVKENGDYLGMDFTSYPGMTMQFSDVIAMGWQPPTVQDLGETSWSTWDYPENGLCAVYFLDLRAAGQSKMGDYDGEASLSWLFDGDENVQESYEGWWRLEEVDGQACLRLDLLCNGGALFQGDENARRISDLFPVLWDEGQEEMALRKGILNETALPFHNEQLEFAFVMKTVG